MKNWSHLRAIKQEPVNNYDYINLKVFEETDINSRTLKNVLRLFSTTILHDLTK